MAQSTCSIPDCDSPKRKRGWCTLHYQRWQKHGDPLYQPPSLQDRFWAKVNKTDGCWEWTGSTSRGYGTFHYLIDGRRQHNAYRLAYEWLVGPVPEGLQLDHLCRNTLCVNPAHLEPVPPKVNVYRGEGITAHKARQTHCIRGHPLSGPNLSVLVDRQGRTHRHCRTCRHMHNAARYQ